MKAIRLALGSFLFLALFAGVSQAQLQRTFVSGLGSDGNPCTRTAPCRTFTQAISQTSAGGEVVVLDSAGYGPVTITGSISLIAPPGVYAGISVFSGDGIDINAGATDTVILRGLTVNNQGSSGNGIVFNTGLKLHVEVCVISGFSSDVGLNLVADHAVEEVIDSIVRCNGIGINVVASSGTVRATIDHVRIEANDNGLLALQGSQVAVTNSVAAGNKLGGLHAQSLTSASAQMDVEGTTVSGNSTGIFASAEGTGPVQVNIARCVISSNIGSGISSGSSSTGVATVRLSDSAVTGNGVGLNNDGSPALLLSRGDNTVEGNTANASGTIGSYFAK
jgi:hypothetical protein